VFGGELASEPLKAGEVHVDPGGFGRDWRGTRVQQSFRESLMASAYYLAFMCFGAIGAYMIFNEF
jgi:hypothetical protein